ncbi:hypothetical protein HKCCE4037_00345 [Rhodobacterales bacterium HKCCE4037]|nr:hypothetical protein [Rhodobacterales bacterium HKCCE4037]
MFIELIAVIFAGLACAGMAMLLNRATGGRLPRWIVPVAAGLGMLAVTISNEYTWFSRTAAQLPDGLEVVMTVENDSWFRPWTRAFPYVERFVAVDTGTARTNAALPDLRLANLYFFGRWSPVNEAPMLFDCAGARSALLIDGASFGVDGAVTDAQWEDMPEDDPILALVCET